MQILSRSISGGTLGSHVMFCNIKGPDIVIVSAQYCSIGRSVTAFTQAFHRQLLQSPNKKESLLEIRKTTNDIKTLVNPPKNCHMVFISRYCFQSWQVFCASIPTHQGVSRSRFICALISFVRCDFNALFFFLFFFVFFFFCHV